MTPITVECRMLPDSTFTFDVFTTKERIWTIEASSNLHDWTTVPVETSADGVLKVRDDNARNLPYRRFYRATATP